jgi:hypothetical protein
MPFGTLAGEVGRSWGRVKLYLCLLFDSANHVRSIEKIEAAEDDAARAEAARLVRALPQIIGYELWKEGRKIAADFATFS